MGLSGAVQWWQEWQLSILVLGSLVVQYILLVASIARKFPIRSLCRPVIWLAYLGSDAIAIYALATLFNRHRKPQQEDGEGGSSILEVLWAPILLIHLGGQDGITAYNIEDNELWTRHILTAVSQVAVAVYVFCQSWPKGGGDMRVLQAAILLFIVGILKCFEKPLALNWASINSLVSSRKPVRRSIKKKKSIIDPLKDYIDKANSTATDLPTSSTPVDFTPYKLFVDLASPSADDRIRMLWSFRRHDGIGAYKELQHWLSDAFQLLYTKEKMSAVFGVGGFFKNFARFCRGIRYSRSFFSQGAGNLGFFALYRRVGIVAIIGYGLRSLALYLLCSAVALFHHSHREAYIRKDVKVTYALLSSTVFLELCSICTRYVRRDKESGRPRGVKNVSDDLVSQYNLIWLLIRNRKHAKMMRAVGVMGLNDFLNQRWRMKSCSSSCSITKSVISYVKSGWEHDIRDVSSYWKFNDNRGQFTLGHEERYQELRWSLEGSFDESVLLWHLATDFCYYNKRASYSHHGSESECMQDSCPHAWCQKSGHHKRAVQCREISNYMMHLLFVNPEMLMPGSRGDLFTAAYEQLEVIIQGYKQPPKERELTQWITDAVNGGGSPPPDGAQQQQGGIIRDAWSIAEVLSGLPEEEMWNVVEGVWVEMLCFSAARCRGYLDAKGLATGVEYLTYVWLLLYFMGMETLADKLQRMDHHRHHRNRGEHMDDPSTSRVSRATTAQEEAAGPSRSNGGATEEEHAEGQSAGYHDSDDIVEEIV